MYRILIGIIAGAFAAFACIFALEYVDALIWPLPAGVDPNTAAGAQGMVERMPLGAKLMIIVGWCLGSLAGGALAARIAHRRIAAWLVAAFLVAGALYTIGLIRHPGWMVACGLVLPWLCAWAVQGAARRHPR